MTATVVQVIVALIAFVSAALWGVAAQARRRATRRVVNDDPTSGGASIARASVRQHVHATLLWLTVGVVAIVHALDSTATDWKSSAVGIVVLLGPLAITIQQARTGSRDSRLFLTRLDLDRRAEEVIDQESRVTKQWAERLVPDLLEDVEGLEFGRASHAGAGIVTGDFLDVVPLGDNRTALVIGDAAGHGLDASISAFQSKYVLRSFLRRFRDPAQVLDEVNEHLGAGASDEELLPVLVAVVDAVDNTLRYASAGHCTNLALIEREVVPLQSTGPLLMLDRTASYRSTELPFNVNDLVVLFTDGLTEARGSGHRQFGIDGIGNQLRRDSAGATEVVAKGLLDAAADFASGHLEDDVTVLAVRRT